MGTNQFFTLASIPPLTNGPQTPIDLLTLAPPTGLDGDLTFICSGDFVGRISIEGSLDNVNWSVLGQFDGRSFGSELSLSPITITNSIVRYLRANVYGNTKKQTVVTVGASQNCNCANLTGGTTVSSPLLDMTVPGNGVSFLVPLIKAGYYFVVSNMAIVFEGAFAGNATSNLILTCGNDAGFSNVIPASQGTITSGSVNTFAPFAPVVGISASGPVSNVLIDAATEIKLKWPVVVGVTALHVRMALTGKWVPV